MGVRAFTPINDFGKPLVVELRFLQVPRRAVGVYVVTRVEAAEVSTLGNAREEVEALVNDELSSLYDRCSLVEKVADVLKSSIKDVVMSRGGVVKGLRMKEVVSWNLGIAYVYAFTPRGREIYPFV